MPDPWRHGRQPLAPVASGRRAALRRPPLPPRTLRAVRAQVAQGSEDYDVQTREPSIFNLGHAYRKKRDFDNAIKWYRAAKDATPGGGKIWDKHKLRVVA